MPEGYTIQLHQRPSSGAVVDEIVALATLLVPDWFTPNVPHDTRRDLLFQDVLCLRESDALLSFLVFTSWDGALYITLMATHPNYHRQGLGTVLMQHFFKHARQLGFDRVVAMTVPEEVKPAYRATRRFYERNGFVLTKRYTELWENGALELVHRLQ